VILIYEVLSLVVCTIYHSVELKFREVHTT
jgi:hypothetical protein